MLNILIYDCLSTLSYYTGCKLSYKVQFLAHPVQRSFPERSSLPQLSENYTWRRWYWYEVWRRYEVLLICVDVNGSLLTSTPYVTENDSLLPPQSLLVTIVANTRPVASLLGDHVRGIPPEVCRWCVAVVLLNLVDPPASGPAGRTLLLATEWSTVGQVDVTSDCLVVFSCKLIIRSRRISDTPPSAKSTCWWSRRLL